MSDNTRSTFEAIWGHELLDSGFVQVPNLLARYYKELKLTNGEFALVVQILTHKYDGRDPWPSHELLATYQQVGDTRHIRRMIDSLEKKGLMLVGVRKDAKGRRMHNIYNFAPLVAKLKQKAVALNSEAGARDTDTATVAWRQKTQTAKANPEDQNSPVDPDLNDPVDRDQIDPLEADQKNPPNNTQKNTYKNKNYKQDPVVVESHVLKDVVKAVEQELGVSVTALAPLFPVWIQEYGAQRLIDCATYASCNATTNVVGYFAAAIVQGWKLGGESRGTSRKNGTHSRGKGRSLRPSTDIAPGIVN